MFKKLGALGIVGLLLMFGGLGIITYYYLEVGVGLALMFVGVGLLIRAMISNVLASMGMGGMF